MHRPVNRTHSSVNQARLSVNRTHPPVNQAHQSVNQMRLPGGSSHESEQHTADYQQTYTDDAPSYSSVMRNQQLSGEEDLDRQVHEQSALSYQGELPENQLTHVLPDSYDANDELLSDFTPEGKVKTNCIRVIFIN